MLAFPGMLETCMRVPPSYCFFLLRLCGLRRLRKENAKIARPVPRSSFEAHLCPAPDEDKESLVVIVETSTPLFGSVFQYWK